MPVYWPITSTHNAAVEHVCSLEGEARIGGRVRGDQLCDVLSDRGTVLEPVAGPAADDPHVVVVRMAIDQEVAARRVLVLTHPAFHDGRVGESGQAPCEPGACLGDAVVIDKPSIVVGIEAWPMGIDADLHA